MLGIQAVCSRDHRNYFTKKEEESIVRNEFYESDGTYRGYMSDSGYIYDDSGRYIGRTSDSGDIYDADGEYNGRISENGDMYDSTGTYKGRISDSGDMYDGSGNYIGRTTGNSQKMDTRSGGGQLLFGQHNDKSGQNFAGNMAGTITGGGVGIILFGILSVVITIMAAPEVTIGLLNPPGCFIYLGICLISSVIGFFMHEQSLKQLFTINYIITMILWFMILFLGGEIKSIIAFIFCIPMGFILMALFSLVMGLLSYVFEKILCQLFRCT